VGILGKNFLQVGVQDFGCEIGRKGGLNLFQFAVMSLNFFVRGFEILKNPFLVSPESQHAAFDDPDLPLKFSILGLMVLQEFQTFFALRCSEEFDGFSE